MNKYIVMMNKKLSWTQWRVFFVVAFSWWILYFYVLFSFNIFHISELAVITIWCLLRRLSEYFKEILVICRVFIDFVKPGAKNWKSPLLVFLLTLFTPLHSQRTLSDLQKIWGNDRTEFGVMLELNPLSVMSRFYQIIRSCMWEDFPFRVVFKMMLYNTSVWSIFT